MRKLQQNKFIHLLTITLGSLWLLATIIFSSGCVCFKSNSPSEWVISKVKYENKVKSLYYCWTLDTTDLNINTWFMDSTGKFEIGDTICLIKK